MAYTPTNWVNDSTPLSAANMNKIENELVALSTKLIVETTAPTSVTLADETEYYFTNVSNLTLTFPSGRFECWIDLNTGSSTPTITFPATAKYIGETPTIGASQQWEISIKNGVVAACQVEA